MPAPAAILFVCSLNAVRSPMAAALLKRFLGAAVETFSAGVQAGEGAAADPLMVDVMAEVGADLSAHHPASLAVLKPGRFDLVVTLSPEAQHRVLDWARAARTPVEYWATPDPSAAEGSREQRLAAYRALRDGLARRIAARFAEGPVI